MDVHSVEGGVSGSGVAEAHMKDLQEQAKYGVNYKSYWVDEQAGKIFRLVEAPDAEAANAVRREARTDSSPTRFTRSRRASSG